MKLSYYQNKRLILAQKSGTVAVCQVSNGAPRWGARPDFHLECLMPPVELVEGAHDGMILEAEFQARYFEHLDTFEPGEIKAALDDLEKEAAPAEVVLCCFEALKKPGQFCHRCMFAKWYQKRHGIALAEL